MIQLATVMVKLKHFVERKKQSKYDDSLLISLDEATVICEALEELARLSAETKEKEPSG
jgi:hypothetical protein